MTFVLSKLYAQEHHHHKHEHQKIEHEAKHFFEKGLYYSALRNYLRLDSTNKNLPLYKFRIALCYFNMGRDDKALPFFEECLKSPNAHPGALNFFLAKCYHYQHRWDKALEFYEKYKAYLKTVKDEKIEKAMQTTNKEIESLKLAQKMSSQKSNIVIKNIGKTINTIYPEYAPIVSADEKMLIFTSCRPDSKGGKIEETDGRYHEDIYVSFKESNGEWGTPKPISDNINTVENDAAIALSPDGHKLIIYRHTSGRRNELASGDLYMSEFNGTEWSIPKKLDNKINSSAWEPSATITSDERVMIFASDRKGGLGGTDLYIIRKNPDGTWKEAENLGPKINTPADEDAPFLHPDGKTLYFSSKGYDGMGEFDIFYSKFDEGKKEWTAPKNVGYPINSAHDDLYITWSADGKRAYFSTMRKDGFGDKDIYVAQADEVVSDLLLMSGTVRDSESTKVIANSAILLKDSNTNEIIGLFQTEEVTGKYLLVFQEGIKYTIEVVSSGYKTKSETFELGKNSGFKSVSKDFMLEKE
ncbi:MAG: hypothetical protein SNJ77_00655 [Cytophagales bacterium]